MICHKNKIIFIHITKCAGSSIESAFGYKPFNILESNRTNLLGWDDELKLYLQHVSISDIKKYDLINSGVWGNYNKFTIVRNPWDRACSSYRSLMNDSKIQDSFENFLYSKGKFTKILNDNSTSDYRGDYLKPQIDYIKYNIDDINIFKFENLDNLNKYFEKLNIDKKIPHINKTPNPFNVINFYKNKEYIDMVYDVYKEDIDTFGYSFEDIV